MSVHLSPKADPQGSIYRQPTAPQSKEASELESSVEESEPAGVSSRQLDPSIVQKDRHRRMTLQLTTPVPQSIRPTFMGVIMPFKQHQAAIAAQKQILLSRQNYSNYLMSLRHDIEILEDLLNKARVPLKTLPQLLRKKALESDLAQLRIAGRASPLLSSYKHSEHFRSISDQPHLLLSHLSVHYLGFLFGGQGFKMEITKRFGEVASHLHFETPVQLRDDFTSEMTTYVSRLSERDFQAFQKEIPLVWQFNCDISGTDMREPKERESGEEARSPKEIRMQRRRQCCNQRMKQLMTKAATSCTLL